MITQQEIATPPVSGHDDVVFHEPPPSFPRLQPPPTLSDEQWQALGRAFGPVHFVYDENGFPYLSLLTESGTMCDSAERLRALMEPGAIAEQS
ncbi:hypothetical protein KA344_04375 [bacterium]|jgi:hypothetical protein|nr:hypothetical protein [bacterium]